tara:strand:- start:2739 stop:3656 length:918 start_codon:yes stop_codon:yes gene_type:complete
MEKLRIKKKILLLGDVDSINIEIINKSFNYLKNKVLYILLCNKKDLLNNISSIGSLPHINEIFDPINFSNYKKNMLNIFNIEDISKKKYLNLLNQIKIGNNLANSTKYDLITMPINKYIFKKEFFFNGMTEYLGVINKKKTVMLMHGERFSIIPLTTHINLKDVNKAINSKFLKESINSILVNIKKPLYKFNFSNIKFLCYNPHCGEEGTLGKEDILIKRIINLQKKIIGPFSADSAFNNIKNNTLFITTYHDQGLIPFKIINKKSFNITLGLKFRRLSPAHGTAKDIKNKNIADNTSYLACLLY